MAAWRIPLSDLDLGPVEEEAVARVIRSGWLTAGDEVAAFEREFAQLCGAGEAIALSSCTAALHLACVALGVTSGAEVIVPTLTFVACANAVLLSGGRPVFADSIGPQDLTVDPDDVERRITPATRGIICVHYGGYACKLDALLEICARHGLFLIEDAAHAPGASWQGRSLGTIGDVGCFSFFGNKNMTTGEGGMALARDRMIRDRIRLLRSHGMTSSSWDRFLGHAFDYDVVQAGCNYRMAELPAALGRAQLRKLAASNACRNELLARYRDRLAAVAGIEVPFAGRAGAAHLAVAIAEDESRRDLLRQSLTASGIQTSLHYPPIHLFRQYRSMYRPGDLPTAEWLAARAITLPLYSSMSVKQVDEVCECMASCLPPPTAVRQSAGRPSLG
jgi:dTDP-4-amino-4,6-dideoxygalactose transaminase